MLQFEPKFVITSRIAGFLARIEAAKVAVAYWPITPSVLSSLRESARLQSTHYSTAIEGNRLTQEQVAGVVEKRERIRGRERDEKEVLGYYAALERAEGLVASHDPISIRHIQILHGLVMAGGSRNAKGTGFRDGQNVIRDSRTGGIVYMPPESKDVPRLMNELTTWIGDSELQGIPCAIRAGIAHYQFATIHPYYDGNGRTARLLTTLVLHLGGYDLKGLYSLEEYYARNLGAYYAALTVGPSHNYYLGRAESDITQWVDYFCAGVAESFEKVRSRAQGAGSGEDLSPLLRRLDPRQRRGLEHFLKHETITSGDVEQLLGVSQRRARDILVDWVVRGFIVVLDSAKKTRKYGLAIEYRELLK